MNAQREGCMISLDNVTKTFNRGRPDEYTAIRDLSIDLERERVVVFKGPSGSGKTTLLSIVGCMSKPTAGRVYIGNEEISGLPDRFLTEIRRRTFGFIFQQLNLIQGITAIENVMLPAYPTGCGHRALRERAVQLFEMLDLGHRIDARVEWLSGGEAQRVAIARALINDPAVLIADEPTAHLDTGLSTDFMEIMARLAHAGKTILVASHDPLVFSSGIVERTIEMRDGRFTGNGTGR